MKIESAQKYATDCTKDIDITSKKMYLWTMLKDAYMQGATEQGHIDIDNACSEFASFLNYLVESGRASWDDTEDWLEKFKKAIE